jgi:hypothetical protein
MKVASVQTCPQKPGVDDVTDGCVDNYDTDWVADQVYPEEDMDKVNNWCGSDCCGGVTPQPPACGDNQPDQTDDEVYEIVDE